MWFFGVAQDFVTPLSGDILHEKEASIDRSLVQTGVQSLINVYNTIKLILNLNTLPGMNVASFQALHLEAAN